MATAPAQFDLAGAKQAGYSDDEILQHLAQSRNFDVQGALSAGYTKPEILAHLSGSTTSGKGLTKPTSPPGFVAGLGHALGAPTTPEEAASMISSPEHPAWDTGSTIDGFN